MKSECSSYRAGDVVIIRDSAGYYPAHPSRLDVKHLKKSNENFNINLDYSLHWELDEFPLNKKVTIVGFQTLNGDDECLIVRYNNKAYWISRSSLKSSNIKGKVIEVVDRTNQRRTKDILKRYWE